MLHLSPPLSSPAIGILSAVVAEMLVTEHRYEARFNVSRI